MAPSSTHRTPPRIGAFFDMDKTLIAENSGSLYMRYRYQRGEITGVELLKGFGSYLQYKLGLARHQELDQEHDAPVSRPE